MASALINVNMSYPCTFSYFIGAAVLNCATGANDRALLDSPDPSSLHDLLDSPGAPGLNSAANANRAPALHVDTSATGAQGLKVLWTSRTVGLD